MFDRPVFIVSPPRSGSTLLFETLARAPDLYTIGDESHQLIEGLPQLNPQSRAVRIKSTDRRTTQRPPWPTRCDAASSRRSGTATAGVRLPGTAVRMLEKTPKNSLRVPFLAQVFPEARFIYLYRDPRQVLSSMIEAWQIGPVSAPIRSSPGWTGPAWSLLLVPAGARSSDGPPHETVAAQWAYCDTTPDRRSPARCRPIGGRSRATTPW